MPFDLFESIVGQLGRPHLLRLNYSGESIHYPRIVDAVRLARASGARVELVSALSAASRSTVESLVDGGLDRLSVSVHTVDEERYREIYGFGSVAGLRQRLSWLLARRSAIGASRPLLDFAFVATDKNLADLDSVVEFALECGGLAVSIHPVIQRDLVQVEFPVEVDGRGQLRPAFVNRLSDEVSRLRHRYSGLPIDIARPLGCGDVLPHRDIPGITTCEQNPWETMHVLSNGDVVVCETLDRTVMGNLSRNSVDSVWSGDSYRRFRDSYLRGDQEECRVCPWRRHQPVDELRSAVGAGVGDEAQLLSGWHFPDGGLIWGRREARLVLTLQANQPLSIRGMLPPAVDQPHRVYVRVNGALFGEAVNDTAAPIGFAIIGAQEVTGVAVVTFHTDTPFVPALDGNSTDARELGFALISASVGDAPLIQAKTARRSVHRRALECVDALSRKIRKSRTCRSLPPPGPAVAPGISVLIPVRGQEEILARCLEMLRIALNAVNEPFEVVIVVDGGLRTPFRECSKILAIAKWIYRSSSGGFNEAVITGLAQCHYGSTYLLNSDVMVSRSALNEVLACRAADVFSIASQIELVSTSPLHVETNRTVLHREGGIIDAWDVASSTDDENLYCGGGASLFQTKLLAQLTSHTRCYAPFYWEDVEWGVTAFRNGYRNLFRACSKVEHLRQATIGGLYTREEIERISRRNRLLFHMRNLAGIVDLDCLMELVEQTDPVTRNELLSPLAFGRTLQHRFCAGLLPVPEDALSRFESPVGPR